MREILFRGKRLDNGEWVYGSLSMEYFTECGCVMISPTSDTCYKVIPETVGQYVEKNDKYGKKIFEGDILLKDNEMRVIYYYPTFAMYMMTKLQRGGATNGMYTPIFECKVIGNIHDNPELLEGGTAQ